MSSSDQLVSWPTLAEFESRWDEKQQQQQNQDQEAQPTSRSKPSKTTTIIVVASVLVVLLCLALLLIRRRTTSPRSNTAALSQALAGAQAGFQEQHPRLQYHPVVLLERYVLLSTFLTFADSYVYRKQLTFGKLLGQGQFSRVVTAQLKVKHRADATVAVKQQTTTLDQVGYRYCVLGLY